MDRPKPGGGLPDTFHLKWSEADKMFVGTCKDHPSLMFSAPTQEVAAQGIISLIVKANTDQ